jgi:MHS family proline/betaine transporter-like MFS transporter
MVVMPTYASIGAVASFGILGARLIQGFSAGGEFGGATALMIEHAPARAGFFGSFQNTTQSIAAIMGSLMAWLVSAGLPHTALSEWGFRLPFVLGLLVAPVGFYVRRHVPETARPQDLALQEAPLLVTPLAGHFSDRRGRLRPMLWGSGLLLLLSYPAFRLVVAHPTAALLGGVLVVLTALRSTYAAPMPALLGEMFPAEIRGVGMSLSYTLGVIVFGGFAQLLLEWLIERTGNAAVPGYYLAFTAAVTFAGLLVIRKNIKLYL